MARLGTTDGMVIRLYRDLGHELPLPIPLSLDVLDALHKEDLTGRQRPGQRVWSTVGTRASKRLGARFDMALFPEATNKGDMRRFIKFLDGNGYDLNMLIEDLDFAGERLASAQLQSHLMHERIGLA
jgi:hypothetical protein